LLRKDVDEKKDIDVSPAELWATRGEYFEFFTLEVFREHLYQKRRTRKWYESKERAVRYKKNAKKPDKGVVLPVDLV
jgi:hypothetical protein